MLQFGSASSLYSPTYTFYIKKRYCFPALCPLMFLREGWGAGGPLPGGALSGLASVWPPLHLSCGVRFCTSLCEGCKVRSTLPQHVCAKAQQGCNYLGLVQHFTRSKKYLSTYRRGIQRAAPRKGKPVFTHAGEAHVNVHHCLSTCVCMCVSVSVSLAPSNVPGLTRNMLHISSVGAVSSLFERSELI